MSFVRKSPNPCEREILKRTRCLSSVCAADAGPDSASKRPESANPPAGYAGLQQGSHKSHSGLRLKKARCGELVAAHQSGDHKRDADADGGKFNYRGRRAAAYVQERAQHVLLLAKDLPLTREIYAHLMKNH